MFLQVITLPGENVPHLAGRQVGVPVIAAVVLSKRWDFGEYSSQNESRAVDHSGNAVNPTQRAHVVQQPVCLWQP